jgi:hypothetical protein
MTTVLWLQCNMRFTKTNDFLSSNFVADPALGFEFGYTNLVCVRGELQNIEARQHRKGNFQYWIGL